METQKNQIKQAKIQPKKENQNKSDEKKLVSQEKYDKFVELKFIEFDGGVLREDHEKNLRKLEEEIKKCDGAIAKKTVTTPFDSGLIKLVEGYPVPEEISDYFKAKKTFSYYFK
jgi:hypothetical protein